MKKLLISVILGVLATSAMAGPKEEKNKALVLKFYDIAFTKLDAEGVVPFIAKDYIQHNPQVGNGVQPLQDFIRYLKANAPQSRATIKRVIAEGDLVMLHVHSQDKPGERGSAVIDIFRVKNGKLTEHWDVIQEVPEKDANGNGMF
jgi:predicted SnoaL-like aldol condensation-catalyzing enzyme